MYTLSLLALFACTPETDSADTGEAADADTDTDTDTDTGTELDMDFVENGPGAGVFFFVTELDLGANACEVNSNSYSLTIRDSITLSNVNPGPQLFVEQATASENQFVNCVYYLDGAFTCDATATGMNLSSYGVDANIAWGLTMGGTFTPHTVDVDGTSHTFSQRWAADLEWTFSMTCSGSECATAAGMAGITFPRETVGTVTAVNYDDPTLPVAM